MKLSLVILNYNSANLLRLCLKNIYSIDIPFEYEVIVVDNASTDNSCPMVKEKYPQAKCVFSKKNIGHAAGNNLGIKEAKGEYIVILNTDIIIPSPDVIQRVVDFMDTHPDVAILGPKLVNGDGTIQNSCLRPYRLMTPIYRRTPLGNLSAAKKDLARHLMLDFAHDETREVDWILGACMFVRKSALEKIGQFNEAFFLYFADYELCDRARENGYKVYYYADSDIIHYHRRESATKSEWPGFAVIMNNTTRVHMKDYIKYLKISKNKKYAQKGN
ncbi:glycosyltransferase [Patescibacteria group bacterium]|nr:glycosyltransferase [Patescibacteria group bacterium]MBU1673356.1 glycosyltransferase [Patescibacteria group bacterium]MBU1963984.1 glycosyltransferase [Patescibacteria group bacterium]